MRPGAIIAALVVVAALSFGGVAFKNSLVAYVPFSQAMDAAADGSTVQIMGVPVKDDTRFDTTSGTLSFVLREQSTGTLMPVSFKSPKPDNFDQAIRIAAIGHYVPSSHVFEADNLLVKCPSKYAADPATNGERSYSGSKT
jgi:cytochrome c-type biogenesis protein CcmE